MGLSSRRFVSIFSILKRPFRMDNKPSKSSKISKISIHLASLEIEEGLQMGQEPSRVRYFRLNSIEKNSKISNII